MSNQDNNDTNSGTFDQIMKELVENDKKREREEDDDDSREPESKRRKVNYTYDSDYVPSESPYATESSNSNAVSDSVSDNGEESEVARINTKYSKRFDAIEDYKEKNELLSENVIQDLMNKVDSGETLSRQEYDTLDRADRLMDRDMYNDKTLAKDIILYENSCNITQKEINDNMDRIAHHERKLDNYLSRLIELDQENNKMSSNNNSISSDNNSNNNNNNNSDSDNPSNSNSPGSNGYSNNPSNSPDLSDNSNNPDSNNLDSNNSNPDSNNPANSPGPNDGDDGHDDDDGFDDFPPSFDFDDF
jgi:hypothetical protein